MRLVIYFQPICRSQLQVQRTTFSRSILVANEMYIGNDFPIVLFVQYELIRKNSLI